MLLADAHSKTCPLDLEGLRRRLIPATIASAVEAISMIFRVLKCFCRSLVSRSAFAQGASDRTMMGL